MGILWAIQLGFMSTSRTHYDELNIARDAPDFVIKAAYKALCQTYHPDKSQDNKEGHERVMKNINVAYAVLGDPTRRLEYNRLLDELAAKAKVHGEKAQFGETAKPTKQQKREKPDLSWRIVGANILAMLLLAYWTSPVPAQLKSLNAMGFPLKRLIVPAIIAAMITSIFYIFLKVGEKLLLKRSFFVACWMLFGLTVFGEQGFQKPQTKQVTLQSPDAEVLPQPLTALFNPGSLVVAIPLISQLAGQSKPEWQGFLGKARRWGQEKLQNSNPSASWPDKAAEFGNFNIINKLKVMNPLGRQKPAQVTVVKETDGLYRAVTEDGKYFELKGNISNLKKEMRESRLSLPAYTCEIKPVMTDEEIRGCQQ